MTPAKATLDKLRSRYASVWGRDWPHDDAHLITLWTEAREFHKSTIARTPPPHVWDHCLIAMREDHEQEATP